MDPEANKKEIFVYLDFDGKLPTEFLKSKMFIRIADLQTKNPLVQVNDMVFKGTYEHSIGTNMFFTKSQTDIADKPFQPVSGCSLELLNLQTKVLNCKQMRVLSENREMPQKNNKIQYNFNWDYKELLKKFEDGTLDLKDMISKDEYSEDEKQESEIENEEIEDTVVDKLNEEHTSEELAIKPDEIETNRLRHAYENLMMLARKPLQRKQIVENVECIEGYSKSFNFKNIECIGKTIFLIL
ncbi:uncharacterized protein LOC115879363 isoform X2 [Sitophilus oryzae]|uniref:Uncharacterized protein LOC115879363 isoform X2 n=1 Tax=Sitophilus oryzae TaxID=7048 RepID=A0A6J2XMB5_SITOR|nr:uncharacterized protein LOC115879363 isoform X2 [Sitophilus oryzae]